MRLQAVTRLMGGEDPESLAAELKVSPRDLDFWHKEFVLAGENRLRQLPGSWAERCLTPFERLAPLATLISVGIAVVLFVQGQAKERADRARDSAQAREQRVRQAYNSLDDRYIDFVKLCLDHPDLDVADVPLNRMAPPSPEQRRRESMALSVLMSILERAYLMYNNPSDSFEQAQWTAWDHYMRDRARQPNFREEWGRSRAEFDASFASYMDGVIREQRTVSASADSAPRN